MLSSVAKDLICQMKRIYIIVTFIITFIVRTVNMLTYIHIPLEFSIEL